MYMRQCSVCGGRVQMQSAQTAICSTCKRIYPVMPEQRRQPPSVIPESDRKVTRKIIALTIGTLLCFGIGAFPVGIFCCVMLSKQLRERKEVPAITQKTEREPNACRTYIAEFRSLPLEHMPLGRFGEETVEQLLRLERQQQGLREMLPAGHPFLDSANEAEAYILSNCKHMLYRLKYCDQGDAMLRRTHVDYLSEKLNENAKLLRDFERLLIEVSQMDEGDPVPIPSLDILAEALSQKPDNTNFVPLESFASETQ